MPDTEPKEAERLKAFELFLQSSQKGTPRSLRSIAATLGVAANTVQRWRNVDGWDAKVNKVLSEAAATHETTQNAIKRRVRRGLLDGLTELQRLVTQASRDSDRINAVKAIAEIALKIEAVTAAAGSGQSAAVEQADFNDDLPEDQPEWPSAPSETTPSPTSPSSDGESRTGETHSLPPSPSPQ